MTELTLHGYESEMLKLVYSNLPKNWSRVIVEGDPGSGKTTLGKSIRDAFDANMTSFDAYLPGDARPYLEQLKYSTLQSDIATPSAKLVIEGLFARKVLETLSLQYDFHIFIKLYNGMLGWELGQYLNPKAKAPESPLLKELCSYYLEYRPFDVCHLLLHNRPL